MGHQVSDGDAITFLFILLLQAWVWYHWVWRLRTPERMWWYSLDRETRRKIKNGESFKLDSAPAFF